MPTIINADNTLGGAIITGDNSGTLEFQAAGNTVVTLNSSRAIGVGASPSFGTSGQFLTSSGSAAAPTWTSVIVAAQGFVTQFNGGNTPPTTQSSGFGLI
jgi:hypothetical protein